MLRTLSFFPCGPFDLIKEVMQQIVYSELGIIDIYDDPLDPCGIQYHACDNKEHAVQSKVRKHLPAILHVLQAGDRKAALQYLFDQSLYVNASLSRCSHKLRSCSLRESA